MRYFLALAVVFSVFSFAKEVSAADDTALYDPTPPADSAFVRIINTTATAVDATIGSASYTSVAAPGISPYRVIPQGEQEAKAGDVSKKVSIEAGKYYSVAITEKDGKKELVTLEDAVIKNPAKAMIYFYNFSDSATASLNAVKQKADIVSGVKAGESASREVNALTIDVAVNDAEGKEVKAFPGVELKRRTGVNFLLTGSGSNRQATMTVSDIAAK
ncbi:MAG: alginate O-acetyltransferase AlgF [Rickettsiales bacterium]